MNLLDWAQFVALVAAALFFLIKAWAGVFVVNLTLEASASRSRTRNGRDLLIVEAKLAKGKSGPPVHLDEAAVRCTVDGEEPRSPVRLIGIERLDLQSHDAWPPSKDTLLRIPIEETLTASCYFDGVPYDRFCVIEIYVIGHSWQKKFRGQWRTSLICPPMDDDSDT